VRVGFTSAILQKTESNPLKKAYSPWTDLLLAMSVSLVALALHIHMVGVGSLWVDEGMSVEIARLPWLDFLGVLWRHAGNQKSIDLRLVFNVSFGP